MRLLNSDEMKRVEQHTAKYGLSYQRMMENAGAACARNIMNVLEKDKVGRRNIAVVCGRGNNGGDGFVVARKLSENGYNVCVILASGYPNSQEATYMYKLVIDKSIPTVWYDSDKIKATQTIKNADVIVDAIYGFSFYGVVSPELRDLFDEINSAHGLKFALDVPSGVYCESGYNDDHCIRANYTIAISALKPAHIIHPAADCCGDIIIANIGIPEESYEVVPDSLYTYNKLEVSNFFPKREPKSHKGSFGHLLCITGSKNMVGANYLVTNAALRCGVGLVTNAFPDCIYNVVASRTTESLLMPLASNKKGGISKECIPELVESLDKFTAIVIGCGMGATEDSFEVVKAVIENSNVPVIIDADGLNVLATDISILQSAKAPIILTPHPKEMSRLTGIDVELIEQERLHTAKIFAQEKKVFLVLKGTNTIVTQPLTTKGYVNASGNVGLAKGGSGDVLSGIMGAFVAQGLEVSQAVTAAVYLHGHCADIVVSKKSKMGMLPSDLIEELGSVFASFEG
ncbi:MAG: NAD(P)H-hydrate dehydratase [Clostridia bacterium]